MPEEHRCTMFSFSPPGSGEYVYRCWECGKLRDPEPWPCVEDGNLEDCAAGIPVGRM